MNSPTDLRERHRIKVDTQAQVKLAQLDTDEDIRFVMGSAQGRRFVWWLLDKAGLYRTSFTGNSTTFFNEGMRNLGLILVDRIHSICPDQYSVMVKESQTDKNKETKDG